MSSRLVTVPDPRLRKKCEEVRTIDSQIKELIEDMQAFVTGRAFGLAAPQFGELLQIFVICFEGVDLVMINPKMVKASEKEHKVLEGCLSIPGKVFLVSRPKIVKLRGLDINGEERSIKGHDRVAQAFMHELQHLHGILVEDIGQQYGGYR